MLLFWIRNQDLVTLGGVGGGNQKILQNVEIEVSLSYIMDDRILMET